MNYSEAKNQCKFLNGHTGEADKACTQNIVCINSFLGKFDYNNITDAPLFLILLLFRVTTTTTGVISKVSSPCLQVVV